MNTTLDGTSSYDLDGDPLTYDWEGPFESSPDTGAMPTVVFPAPTGAKTVDLTVTDPFGETDSCSASVTVLDTLAPLITPPDDVLYECTSPDGTPVDLGLPTVSDICDASVDVINDAPALFPIGSTEVLWTATDDSGNQSTDGQSVTVQDTTPPEIFCNSPETFAPPDAPISFIASAEDICDTDPSVAITEYNCYKFNKKGKLIGKKASCIVTFEEGTISIQDTGGVGNLISWTVEATDNHGNQSVKTCEIMVINPTD
jgi:hypothetical protein